MIMKNTNNSAFFRRLHEHKGSTVNEVIRSFNRQHTCPKCKGKGIEIKMVDKYPFGLPDSGWVSDMQPEEYNCTVCDGFGYTKTKMIAKPVHFEYVEEK